MDDLHSFIHSVALTIFIKPTFEQIENFRMSIDVILHQIPYCKNVLISSKLIEISCSGDLFLPAMTVITDVYISNYMIECNNQGSYEYSNHISLTSDCLRNNI
jgi:hypothetical protein